MKKVVSEMTEMYMTKLRDQPIKTKAATSAVIGAIGEVVAQYLHCVQQKKKQLRNNKNKGAPSFSSHRVLVSALYGYVYYRYSTLISSYIHSGVLLLGRYFTGGMEH